MRRRDFIGAATLPPLLQQAARASQAEKADWRNIRSGWEIPDEGYCDQPYVVITNDGKWLCVLTTGRGIEGQPGQHIIALRSGDQGRTWTKLADIEPAGGPEASWAMPLKVPSGRVYVFYTYNRDNIRRVPGDIPEAMSRRVDTLGVYAFKYSDDNGRTWSKQRFEIPIRKTRIDLTNNFGGNVLCFWGVGKPVVHRGAVIFGFAKVGRWGAPGTQVVTENFLFKSDNILGEKDPNAIGWRMLPEGEDGLRSPHGQISDEINPVSMNDGSLFATFRTIDGYLCQTYSRDDGESWSKPEYGIYSPGGRRIKHPRAANFVKKFSNGKYLLWYHNAWGEAIHQGVFNYSQNRNPVWIAGGIEKGGFLHWSEPELLLYDPDGHGISYPDFIEEKGRFYVTETQKSIARVHEIPADFLQGLWGQSADRQPIRDGLTADLDGAALRGGAFIKMPEVPDLLSGGGFAIEMWIRFDELSPGQTIFDTRNDLGAGVRVGLSDRHTLSVDLSDGRKSSSWDSDPGTGQGTLRMYAWQHVVAIIDGGPKIISFVIDGTLNDGGAVRTTGWGWFDKGLGSVNGSERVKIAPTLRGELRRLRIYNRPLRTSEAVASFRAG